MQSEGTKRAGRFVLGSRVTVCSDEACARVVRFGTVKRIGNEGASWRLGGTCEWYDASTGMRLGGFDVPYYARPYQEGDEEALVAEQKHARETQRLQAAVTAHANGLSSASYVRAQCDRAASYAEASRADAERALARANREIAEHRTRHVVLLEKEATARAALERAREELRRHVERG